MPLANRPSATTPAPEMPRYELTDQEADALAYAARLADTPGLRGQERELVEQGLEHYKRTGVLAEAYESLKGQRRLFRSHPEGE